LSARFNAKQLWRCASESSEVEWGTTCNSYLDLECWGPPPWSADQWVTLRVVMEMAGE